MRSRREPRGSRPLISYQLLIEVGSALRVRVGALGVLDLPAGWYVYTGSARRGLEARIARHLRKSKPCRWHIDYLTNAPHVTVRSVLRSSRAECTLNRATRGRVPVPGFGSTDCRSGCRAHLKMQSAHGA